MRRKRKAGERKRDERRRAKGPRYHGTGWHDHAEPRVIEPELAELDALPEAESSGERVGMRKAHASRK
jgi:hypothetical protein